MKRTFRNVSGNMYYIGEIERVIKQGKEKDYVFTEEDIDSSELLQKLIKDGIIVEKNIEENSILEPVVKAKESRPVGKTTLAQVVGGNRIQQTNKEVSSDYNISSKPEIEPSFNAKDVFSFGDVNTVSSKKERNNKLKFFWCGPAQDASGYGKMSREILREMYHLDAEPQLELWNIPDFRCTVKLPQELSEMQRNKVPDDAARIYAIMPLPFYPGMGKKISYTMIECYGLSESFKNRCNAADEIWVPSKFCMDVFTEAKLKPQIHYIPLGVNTSLYKPLRKEELDTKSLNIKTKSFSFISVFGWSLRKGSDVLFRAYLEQFTDKDDVSLILVSRKNGSSSDDNVSSIREDIKNYIKKYCPDPAHHPHIVHLGDSMPEEVMPHLYNMAQCFLLPSRGEGFSLPPAEAGACGIPVISTRCCGQMDFLNDDNSYLIDIAGIDRGSQQIRDLSSYYEDQPFAVLDKKSLDQLKYYMQHVIDNYSEAKGKAELLRKNIVDNFQWKHTAQKIHNKLS